MNKLKSNEGSGTLKQRGEREMLLRCQMRKKGNYYIATCLELGIISQGKKPQECRRRLNEAIQAYIEVATVAAKNGKKVAVHPVAFYPVKRFLFDLKYKIGKFHKLRKDNEFILKKMMPVGI